MTREPFPTDRTDLVRLLRSRAEQLGETVAFSYLPDGEGAEQPITYAALDRKARAIAARLQDLHAQGQCALLLYPPSAEYIAAFFGCLYAGVVAVPAYPPRANKPAPRVHAIVADAGARLALCTVDIHRKLNSRLAETPDLAALTWLTTDDLPLDPSVQWTAPDIRPDTLAYIQYTSGTTATPRGVPLTHGNLLHNSRLIAEGFTHTPEDHGVFWLPVYHDMGLIGGVLQPLWNRLRTTLMPPAAFLQSPVRWLRAISERRATISGGPDMAYDLCTRQVTAEQRATLDLSCWKQAFTGAEPIRAETLDRFVNVFGSCGFRREAFYPCYGIAEATLMVAGGERGRAPTVKHARRRALAEGRFEEVPAASPEARSLVGCGRPLGGQEVRIVNPGTSEPCPEGTLGEIWVRGPCVAGRYWNQPALSAQAFGATLPGRPGEPFLRSQDLGFFLDGELYFAGRLPDLLHVDGLAHDPHDVERSAEGACPVIKPGFSAAFTVPEAGQARVVLVGELDRHKKVDLDVAVPAVRAALREHHGLELHALVLVRLLSIPKTTSGKLQRGECRARYLAGALDVVAQWQAR